MSRIRRRITSSQMIILGFLLVILLGSLLLQLPAATKSGQGAGFSQALFTATSAVCVTGLVVQDTGTYWSAFGQAVILILIQVGGMGVITVAAALFMTSGREISLKQRSTIQEAISAHQLGGIVRLTGFIVRMSLAIECLGALAMMPVFTAQFGIRKGIWYAVFHSVSAFCNAGFDLMGTKSAPFSSLTSFAASPVINGTVMTLIVIGGIGFMTWEDIRTNKWHVRHFRMQTKVILVTTFVLILLPALYFYVAEFGELEFRERIWKSLFQAVTPRTAGFNTADQAQMSELGQTITIVLMLIGGSPGSTAGGMKTTTFAVMVSTAVAVFARKEQTQFFGRRIGEEVVRNAMTVLTMYLVLFMSGGLIISGIEQLPILSCLFETASAIGTVGLSLGITPTLSGTSRAILIALMYIGRVGGLTLVFSAVTKTRGAEIRLPKEPMTVG